MIMVQLHIVITSTKIVKTNLKMEVLLTFWKIFLATSNNWMHPSSVKDGLFVLYYHFQAINNLICSNLIVANQIRTN